MSIKVLGNKGQAWNFTADKFRIDESGRLVLLNNTDVEETPTVVAVFSDWTGVYQTEAWAAK